MMTNKDNLQIDEKLSSLLKPTMSYEAKNLIHSILLKELQKESPMKKRRESYKHLFINIAGIAVFALLAFFVFNSIQGNNNFQSTEQSSFIDDTVLFQGISYKLEDYTPYKGSYIGDNSSVISILDELPGAKYRKTIELQTKKQPYGLTVNYGRNDKEQMTTSEYEEYWTDNRSMLLYNASVLFMVIDNLDTIDFHLEPENDKLMHLQFSRAEIEGLYGRDMSFYVGDSKSWKQEVLSVIKSDSAINEFYRNR